MQIRRPGPKRPNAWDNLERPRNVHMAQSVETWLRSALAMLKASAPANTLIRMLGARDQISVPSLMWSPPLQIQLPAPLCLLWLYMSPLCLLLHARPLLLQWRAPLRILSHSRTCLGQSRLHICLQAVGLVLRLRLFPLHRSGVRLRLFPPPVQGSDMQGHLPRQLSGLTLCPGTPARACVCPQGSTSRLSRLFVLLTSPI